MKGIMVQGVHVRTGAANEMKGGYEGGGVGEMRDDVVHGNGVVSMRCSGEVLRPYRFERASWKGRSNR